jgi:cell division protein FtsQ
VSRTGTTTRDRTAAPAPERSGRPGAPAAAQRPRRWQRRRGRRHPLLVAALVPLVLATAAWVLWASPLLAVRTVQVDGARTLTAAEVRQAAGVRTGTPLLRADVDAAAARVRRMPQVAAAQVSRGWPDRIVITVTERAPVAVVDQAGQQWLVDAAGVLFATVSGAPPQGVVPVDVPDPGPGDAATRAALAAVAALPGSLRPAVTTVHATTAQDVTLTLTDGTTVVWGDGGLARQKAAALGALLDQIHRGALQPARTIDVSVPGKVVLR